MHQKSSKSLTNLFSSFLSFCHCCLSYRRFSPRVLKFWIWPKTTKISRQQNYWITMTKLWHFLADRRYFQSCPRVPNIRYDFWRVGEMFDSDSADTCYGKFPITSMGGRAEGLVCADPAWAEIFPISFLSFPGISCGT
jgi:hypothetical protein